MLETIIKYRYINLVGDKGYAALKHNKQLLKINYNINLIYPHKKNQKLKTAILHKQLLKSRYVIENVFSKLKTYTCICCRKDKLYAHSWILHTYLQC